MFIPPSLHRVLSRMLSLLIIFLMLSAAAVWTRHLYGRPIGQQSAQPPTTSRMPPATLLKALQLDADNVQLIVCDSASWQVVSKENQQLGTLISSAPYASQVKGFAGPTPLFLFLDTSGKIQAITSEENAETPHFFRRAQESLLPHWLGLTAEAGANLQVDAVSGATFSSRAIIENIRQTLQARAVAQQQTGQTPVIGWGRTAAVLSVLLFGIFTAWRLRGNRMARLVVLVLNVGVLGFWCGQFLSLSLLRGWIAHGLDPLAYLPTLAVLFIALLLPFLGKKHYYCTWVCPFGSLQELTARLPLPKIQVSPSVYRWMKRIRWTALALLLLLLWTGLGGFLLDYEPFTAFLVTTVSPVVLILGALFILSSCFVPRLWCHSLCPMGALLDLSDQ